MRLINAQHLKLEEFQDESNLSYAILSHRWENEEVTFDDMQSLDIARTKKGFHKISKCCTEALRFGLAHVWVDTCCIDKRSSSELSEAINSMFRWYRNSQMCFAYLSDVGTNGPEMLEQFKSSQWFQRGWTLQELLAPSTVFFYNSSWLRFGSKTRLVKEIAEASAISEAALTGNQSIFDYSIAQRMHWAAKRKTTRVEDRAYSLMGLFNVNMAMLYDEGERAFVRLQEEIIKHSDDPSIFAWTGVRQQGGGLLTLDLGSFADPHVITIAKSGKLDPTSSEPQPWTMTNLGLLIELMLTPWAGGIYMAVLDCHPDGAERENISYVVGIFLQCLGGRQFRRVLTDFGDFLIEKSSEIRLQNRISRRLSIYLRQDGLTSQTIPMKISESLPIHGVKLLPIPGIEMASCVSTRGDWDSNTGVVQLNPGQYGPVALIDLLPFPTSLGLVHIGMNFNFQPRILMGRNSACVHRLGARENSSGVRCFWDVSFAHDRYWNSRCFATNPWPGRDTFEGAIEDEFCEDVFTYDLPQNQETSLIHMFHRPRNGGPRILVGELSIGPITIKGKKIWSVGIKVFLAGGASKEDSSNLLESWRQDDTGKEPANQQDGISLKIRGPYTARDGPSIPLNILTWPWNRPRSSKNGSSASLVDQASWHSPAEASGRLKSTQRIKTARIS